MSNTGKLILRNLYYYRRLNILLLLGVAITSTIITGSLILGDSMSRSLLLLSQERTGKVQWVCQGNTRFFSLELADRLHPTLKTTVAPCLLIPGMAASSGGQFRVPNCQVIGARQSFFKLSSSGNPITIKPGHALLNPKIARQLHLATGDELMVLIKKPTALPSDAPFAPETDFVSLRLTVQAIILPADFSEFSLNLNPEIPANIFINLDFLAEKLNQPKQINTLLIAQNSAQTLSAAIVKEALQAHWKIEDTDLAALDLPGQNQFELRTGQVFLPSLLTDKILNTFPQGKPLFTYFVNSISKGQQATPYSMVGTLPATANTTLQDNEIIINSWLADDLKAKPGDQLTLHYYSIAASRKLQVEQHTLVVHSIVPLRGWAKDQTVMPDFPGLSDAGNCGDWKPGIPIDLNQIRAKDERYWDQYRGTPKAYVSLSTAQRLWSNPFGNLTGIRFPQPDKAIILRTLNTVLTPELFGLHLTDIKAQSTQSAQESIDFSQLFLGLSFFLVIAALLLIALFFNYAIDQRASEIKTYQALGFRKQFIRKIFLSEGLLIAIIGSLLGLVFGILYNHLLLYGLTTFWYEAVRTTALHVAINPVTLCLGFLAGVVFSGLSIYLCLHSWFKQSIAVSSRNQPLSPLFSWLNGIVFAGVLASLLIILKTQPTYPPILFVLFGMLLLVNGLFFFMAWFARLDKLQPKSRTTSWSLGIKNINRRLKSSLGIIAMLAIGIFMIIAVSANRQNVHLDAAQRSSGTGGFSLFCKTTHPINKDLNTEPGKKAYGLKTTVLQDTQFFPMRLKAGNDASCLNINRTLLPHILSVYANAFAKRGSFTFAATLKDLQKDGVNPWELLNTPLANGKIPAIADQTAIQWGLGKKLGDTISLTDDQGKQVELQLVASLANSIFQGYVLISEQNFLRHFSSVGGFQVLLVDTLKTPPAAVQQELERAFLPMGIEISNTADRLAEFNSVQNTYLSIFLLLGGLGLMLSTLGLGIVLARNLIERKGELALLSAVGYTRKKIRALILSEYLVLLLAGIIIGTVSGLIAVLPVITAPGTRIPYTLLISVVLGITLTGLGSLYVASRFALPGNLVKGLREE